MTPSNPRSSLKYPESGSVTEYSESKFEFKLGDLRVEPARNRLTKDDDEFHLEPRVMDVLCLLAERAGEVIPRETLITRLWPSEYGADESLTRAVSLIRKTLREAGAGADAIETIKKRGYRLRLPVLPASKAISESPIHPDRPEHEAVSALDAGRVRRRTLATATATAVVLLAILLIWLVRKDYDPVGADSREASIETSVAVLAFEALSEDDSDSYLGAGIAEEILNALSRFPDLQVIARTSAFAVDRSSFSLGEIGTGLGVDHLVTGSVRRNGQELRISVQLVRAADGVTLWSNSYEVAQSDLFATEDEIVLDIAQTLQVRLGVGAAARRNDGVGVDPLAYEQYLQGLRWFGDRMRRDGNREQALAAFQRAVDFDPDFADAWAGIGAVGTFSVGSPLSRDREAFQAMTRNALDRAIELDPDNSKAHAVMAMFSATQLIDIEAARYHLSQAQTTAPNAALTHYASAALNRAIGSLDAALTAYDRTMALDPLNTVIARARAELLIEMGRFNEAMTFYEDCYQRQCLGEGFIVFASTGAILTGSDEQIDRWLHRLDAFVARIAELPDHRLPPSARMMDAFFSIRLGRDDAEAMTRRVQQRFEDQLITDNPGIWIPTLARVLDQNVVLDTLHLAYEQGDLFSAAYAFTALTGVDPYPDWLLAHPRYAELWKRPGMPELAAAWRAQGRTAGLPVEH